MTPFGGQAAKNAVRSIDPSKVRFSQSSIRGTFRGGGKISDLAAGLRSGKIKPGDVPPVRLVNKGGNLYTLDNRRLEAFRRAGVKIRYRMATKQEVTREAWKFTTKTDGKTLRIRGN